MKVAVPFPQHSPRLGQREESQTVRTRLDLKVSRTLPRLGPDTILTMSQSGFLSLLIEPSMLLRMRLETDVHQALPAS
jgi:hypothetical protein